MKSTSITIIEASEGCWLCESAEGLDCYTFTQRVMNPEEGAWREVTEEEKVAIEQEIAERLSNDEQEP